MTAILIDSLTSLLGASIDKAVSLEAAGLGLAGRDCASLEIHVEVDTEVQTDEEISATVVRAAQEIITNAIKYAEATELVLTVTLDNDMLTLTGANDGVAPQTITPGHSLTGLRERLEIFGGDLEIRPTPHFTVEARLPMIHDRQVQT